MKSTDEAPSSLSWFRLLARCAVPASDDQVCALRKAFRSGGSNPLVPPVIRITCRVHLIQSSQLAAPASEALSAITRGIVTLKT